MDKEQVGRKGTFDRHDEYHNKFNGGGHKCCDPSVSFQSDEPGWQTLEDRCAVLVFTPAEICDLIAESEARGQCENHLHLHHYAVLLSTKYADLSSAPLNPTESGISRAIEIDELGKRIVELSRIMDNPDTQAYTDKIRGEALEEALAAVKSRRDSWTQKWLEAVTGKDCNSLNYADILKGAEEAIRALKP